MKAILQRNFYYRGKYFYKNFKNILQFISDIYFLLKNGYDRAALWDIDIWFVDTMRDILTKFKNNTTGIPSEFEDNPGQWQETLSRMIVLLDNMDMHDVSDSNVLSFCTHTKEKEQAKNQFFELFSKHFYELWD